MASKEPMILGCVRVVGRSFAAGDEEALLREATISEEDATRLRKAGVIANFPNGWTAKSPEEDSELIKLPAASKMGEYLAGVDDLDLLRELQSADRRKPVKRMYARRIAELESLVEVEEGEDEPDGEGEPEGEPKEE